MEYLEFKEAIVDYLSGNLSVEKKKVFEKMLATHSEYKREFEEMSFFWNVNEEEVPEPSMEMDMKFYTMMNSEIEKEQKDSSLVRFIKRIEVLPFRKVFYTLGILTIGFFLGKGMNNETEVKISDEIEVAKKETEEVRSQLVLTLLDQPSANQRLQAVNEVSKLSKVTETIIKALFTTLNNDENVNVRLSAIESLKNYTDMPIVREGLVASIVHQKSPLVQIELADVMVLLQEKEAVKPFKELIDQEDINSSAKQKIEESISNIY
ncbi:HEAT repeat domain-containing protein [uncultured Tenacibaculum sp.]|uniref:HEAT repeat domain-containing protein n=1 Tax=uncultured Tenacibaculum sp. TaxID=174713 RepID=UPI00262AB95E|nr:HEAT repeat domain-containing protein [uncultured Tenacibaculum sp.]